MTPLTELTLGVMEQNEAVRLEKEVLKPCGCTMLFEMPYKVQFPAGTVEEVCQGDLRFREESLIHLPNEKQLRKCVKWPCRQSGCTHTYLLLQKEETA